MPEKFIPNTISFQSVSNKAHRLTHTCPLAILSAMAIGVIFFRNKGMNSDSERCIVLMLLLALMNGLKGREHVVVTDGTNRVNVTESTMCKLRTSGTIHNM